MFNPHVLVDVGEPVPFSEFVFVNGMTDAEAKVVSDALAANGEYRGGGGAAPEYTVRLAAPTPEALGGLTITVPVQISSETIANLFVTAIESGDPVTTAARGGWCAGIELESPGDVAPDDPAINDPWYANPRRYEDPALRLKIVVVDDEDTGATTDHFIGLKEIAAGLTKLAASADYNHHFSDIVGDNIDAATADIFLQFVCFGEEVYA